LRVAAFFRATVLAGLRAGFAGRALFFAGRAVFFAGRAGFLADFFAAVRAPPLRLAMIESLSEP
jgi:hypothetical protein